MTVDAGDAVSLSVEFVATVTTEQENFELNGVSYTTDGGATFSTQGVTDDTKVVAGTIVLDEEGNTSATGSADGEQEISVTAGSVNVVFGGEEENAGKAVTISDIASDESFKVGDTEYKMTEAGLISGENIWNGEEFTDSVDVTALADTSNWAVMIETDEDGVVDLASFTGTNAIIVDSKTAPTMKLGTVAVADGTITVTADSDNGAQLTGINLGADAVTLVASGFTGDVTTAPGSSTYTIKTDADSDDSFAFEASNSALTINVGDEVALKAGTVIIPSVDEEADGFAIYGGQTVKVTGDTNGVKVTAVFEDEETTVESITDLNANGTVEYNGNTYKFYESGILSVAGDETVYYLDETVETNILDPKGDKVEKA